MRGVEGNRPVWSEFWKKEKRMGSSMHLQTILLNLQIYLIFPQYFFDFVQ